MRITINYFGRVDYLINHPKKGDVGTIVLNTFIDAPVLRLFTGLETVVSPGTAVWIPDIPYVAVLETVIRDSLDARAVENVIGRFPFLRELAIEVKCKNNLARVRDAIAVSHSLKTVGIMYGSISCEDIVDGVARNKGIENLRMYLTEESSVFICKLTHLKSLTVFMERSNSRFLHHVVDLAMYGRLSRLHTKYLSANQFMAIMEKSNLEYLYAVELDPLITPDYIQSVINNRKMIEVVARSTFLSLRSISIGTRPIPLRNVGTNYGDARIVTHCD